MSSVSTELLMLVLLFLFSGSANQLEALIISTHFTVDGRRKDIAAD